MPVPVESIPPRPLELAEVEALGRSGRCVWAEPREVDVGTGEVRAFDLLLQERIVRLEFDGHRWVAST